MKKILGICLAVALLLAMLAGCGSSRTQGAEAAADAVQIVHSIDELISAIGPGAQIRLAEGEYNLAQSRSYGQRTGNPYVKWKDLYGYGFALTIHDVDNLSIQGSGRDSTKLIAECPEADVLRFEDCTSIHLSDFTAGHTPQSEGCSAGVLYLFRTLDVSLDRLGLFGCGSVGVNADRTDAINISDCEIYDCSSAGINLASCKSATISHSAFQNNGKMLNGFSAGYAVFGIYNCDLVQIDSCTVENNVMQYILSASDTKGVHLLGNHFTENSAAQGMFMLTNSDTTIDSNNQFEDNTFSRWYAKPWDGMKIQYAVNERGENIFVEDPEPVHSSSEPVEAAAVITAEQKQVKAATVDEFLAAIDSDTEIILTAQMYDLSTAADYGEPGNALHYTWEEVFDGWQLNIMGVENFSIVGAEDEMLHTISAVPRYANVLNFVNCRNILTKGFTAGHTAEPGTCMGGVLNYLNCTNAAVDQCSLYGCGIYGVETYQVENMQIVNSCIYECSYGGMLCAETKGLRVGGCTFWDLGGDTFQLSGCTDVTIDGKEIGGDYYGD